MIIIVYSVLIMIISFYEFYNNKECCNYIRVIPGLILLPLSNNQATIISVLSYSLSEYVYTIKDPCSIHYKLILSSVSIISYMYGDYPETYYYDTHSIIYIIFLVSVFLSMDRYSIWSIQIILSLCRMMSNSNYFVYMGSRIILISTIILCFSHSYNVDYLSYNSRLLHAVGMIYLIMR